MSKIVIWGTAGRAEAFYQLKYLWKDDEIVAVIDTFKKGGDFHEFKICAPERIIELNFDVIVICSGKTDEIMKSINNIAGDRDVTVDSFDARLNVFKNKIINLYENTGDVEIKRFIEHLKENPLTALGPYEGPKTLDEVFYDNDEPYVLFDEKKLYLPKDYRFTYFEGKKFVPNILTEQGPQSPHIYCHSNHTVHKGDVIVDAGVCEGNFALRYVDVAEKIYLVEPSQRWMHALQRTFEPYKDKVVYCEKFLGRYNSAETVTLDTLVGNGRVDFVKMDIEGAEVDAILGAKKTLRDNKCRLSVCSYHRNNDVENLRFLLESLGYSTSVSSGYMFFLYDNNIADTMDFRRGVVYANR